MEKKDLKPGIGKREVICEGCGQYESECRCPKETILMVVCAWCGKVMGEKEGKGVSGVSHSICDECTKGELK